MKDKVALITGASDGIGRATAIAFAARGAKVVVCDINVEGGEKTREIIKEQGGDAIFCRADVSNNEDIQKLIADTVQAYGRLDFAHNNAGISPSKLLPIDEYPEESWHSIIAVNLTGVWLCMKYQLAQMLKQNDGGSIVNTSSIAGLMAISGSSPYVAAKHGVVGITKTTALEYANTGIRINAVCPGYIATPMVANIMQQNKGSRSEDTLLNRIPVKHMGKPEDIAEAVVWLCSDVAAYMTGHALPVDGGMTAQGLGPTS